MFVALIALGMVGMTVCALIFVFERMAQRRAK